MASLYSIDSHLNSLLSSLFLPTINNLSYQQVSIFFVSIDFLLREMLQEEMLIGTK